MKNRKPIPYKIKAILQKEIGSVCPFCTNKDVEHFEIHHIDENPEKNELSNLIMLCPTCHSKITKGDISLQTVIETKIKVSKPKREIPKELIEIGKQIWEKRNSSFYTEAIEQVKNVIATTKETSDDYSEAYFNSVYATLIQEKNHSFDEAASIKLKSIEVFKKYNDLKQIQKCYSSLSHIEIERQNLLQAKSYALKAHQMILENCDEIKNYFVHLAISHDDLGWIEHQLGNYNVAIDEYKKSLSMLISESIQDDIDEEKIRKHQLAITYHHLGLSYEKIADVINTKDNYTKSINVYREINLQYDLARVLFLHSHVFFLEAEYEEGETHLNEAIKIYLEIKEYGELVRCLDLKGKVNFTLGKEETAYEIFIQSCEILEQHGGNLKLLEDLYHKVGEINFKKDNLEKASEYFNKSKELSERNNHYFGIADSIHGLAKIEKKKAMLMNLKSS
ncbi:MAG: HNH endonuclease [Bacteroidetes bacterium]|nr:HNH endonuclease [Bacteroidota bacterium]